MIDIWSELCLFFNALVNIETTGDDEFVGSEDSSKHFVLIVIKMFRNHGFPTSVNVTKIKTNFELKAMSLYTWC